jgi:hypothetical protein
VAAVNVGDTLCIDFMEEGRDCLCFVGSKHGNENDSCIASALELWCLFKSTGQLYIVETIELVQKSATQ